MTNTAHNFIIYCIINNECFTCEAKLPYTTIKQLEIDCVAFLESEIGNHTTDNKIELIMAKMTRNTTLNIPIYLHFRKKYILSNNFTEINELREEYKSSSIDMKRLILEDVIDLKEDLFNNYLKRCNFE